MSQKTERKAKKNAVKIRKDKVLTFFDQSTSNGMTRFYGVVSKETKIIVGLQKRPSIDQKNANDS
ncbi:MAG: hypothetical protein HRU41_29420 [Saprospiraceae bacterium]|nr:hypothetical protein [Saprospiraceae bacterium]